MHEMRAVVWVTFGQRVEPEVQLSQSWQLVQLFHLFKGRYAVIVQDQPLQHFQMSNPLGTKQVLKGVRQQLLANTFISASHISNTGMTELKILNLSEG